MRGPCGCQPPKAVCKAGTPPPCSIQGFSMHPTRQTAPKPPLPAALASPASQTAAASLAAEEVGATLAPRQLLPVRLFVTKQFCARLDLWTFTNLSRLCSHTQLPATAETSNPCSRVRNLISAPLSPCSQRSCLCRAAIPQRHPSRQPTSVPAPVATGREVCVQRAARQQSRLPPSTERTTQCLPA
jgi:hypothetical protein